MATYTVKSGDSAFRIAGNVYDDQRAFQFLMDANPNIDWGNLKPGQIVSVPDKEGFSGFVSEQDFAAATGIQPGTTAQDFLDPGTIPFPGDTERTGERKFGDVTTPRIVGGPATGLHQTLQEAQGLDSIVGQPTTGLHQTLQEAQGLDFSPFIQQTLQAEQRALQPITATQFPSQEIGVHEPVMQPAPPISVSGGGGGGQFIQPFNTLMTDTGTGQSVEQQFLEQQDAFMSSAGGAHISNDFQNMAGLSDLDMINSGYVRSTVGWIQDQDAQAIIQEAEARSRELPISGNTYDPLPPTFYTGQILGLDAGTGGTRPRSIASPVQDFTFGRGVLINWRTGGF